MILAALVSAAACEMIDSTPRDIDSGEGSCQLEVRFADKAAATRVTGQSLDDESRVRNVQIFVFRSDNGGILDASAAAGFDQPLDYSSVSGSGPSLNLTCTTGEREIWAVVNGASDLVSSGAVGSRDELLLQTSALSENSSDGLFMIGSVEQTLAAGSSSVEIPVRRVCASVILESVTNAMEAPAYRKPGSFRLKDVYLMNVPARIDYGLSISPSSLGASDWYAKLGKEADPAKSALILDESAPHVLDYNNTYKTVHSFYAYPNDCPPSTDANWSPRATVLVLEAEFDVDGVTYDCYYPVTLYKEDEGTGLEGNRQYRVRLTIKRPGSDNPNEPVEFDRLSGVIEVVDWEDGAEYTETI